MRVSFLPVVLAGAGLVRYATAAPIRVVVISSHNDVSSNVVFEPGMPLAGNAFHPGITTVTHQAVSPDSKGIHHFCSSLKNKAVEISNKFRETLGLPSIPTTSADTIHNAPHPSFPHNEVKILPFIGTPLPVMERLPQHDQSGIYRHPIAATRVRGGCNRSFVHRVHRALTILGPWEGRAVAFVLGCGIGVLFRMFWVMAILIARSFRSHNNGEDEDVQHILVFERDAEDILVPPPQYTDEKVAIAAAEADKKNDTTA